MLQHPKLTQSPTHILCALKTPQHHNIHTRISPPRCSKFSRRELAIFTNSSLLVLTTQTLQLHSLLEARADENPLENAGEIEQREETPQENVRDGEQQVMQTDESSQVDKVVNEQQEIQAEETLLENKSEVEEQEARVEENPQVEQQVTQAEEKPQEEKGEIQQQAAETAPKSSDSPCTEQTPTKRAFLDISIDGKPTGRIVVGLYEQKAPVGAGRFSDLVSGKAGITFRRKEFIKIMPNYVQHGGIRSYGVDAELASRTGKSFKNDTLVNEWEKQYEECPGTKNLAGSVSIIVRDPSKPPPKIKLVARGGKLEIDQEEIGIEPNGTEFTITTKDSPELDSSALVIGKVIQGLDVVEKIGQVKTVQDNTSSPYFRVAKLIGDKRAVVAERGFNRPYSKVIVTNCGLL